ncbi:hypothetical protein [Desulfofalx alkaliphila]|uniref:hypothetical protein n=1 Tax=Desulfofalx alkaliphila TaxID=105483 RepID=UPI0004E16BD0|nr:hypothetical protein [Desulfofalx alkaliphila]
MYNQYNQNDETHSSDILMVPVWLVFGFIFVELLRLLAFLFNLLAFSNYYDRKNANEANSVEIELCNARQRSRMLKLSNAGVRERYVEKNGKWVKVDV